MDLKKCLLTKNDCYKKATKITPKGIIVHSTGANNPYIKRYVQPDDGLLGKNLYGNHWNKGGVSKCVHAFLGKDKNKNVQVYQTLPFTIASWGVGKGKKGSYNYNPTAYIQFEICEDNLKDEVYFNKAFDLAAEFCAYLCKEFKLDVKNVISHHEAYERGYGSNHSDCDHWLKKFGKDMNWFRKKVSAFLNPEEPKEPKEPKQPESTDTITVDGIWGIDTTKLAQKVFKTTVDGEISNQSSNIKKYHLSISTKSWEYKKTNYKNGSMLIKAIQKKIGATVNGQMDKTTIKKLQIFLGFKGKEVDGYMGKDTIKAFQKWLNEQ